MTLRSDTNEEIEIINVMMERDALEAGDHHQHLIHPDYGFLHISYMTLPPPRRFYRSCWGKLTLPSSLRRLWPLVRAKWPQATSKF